MCGTYPVRVPERSYGCRSRDEVGRHRAAGQHGHCLAKFVGFPELDMAGVAVAIDATESRLRAAVPFTQVIYIEPDLLQQH